MNPNHIGVIVQSFRAGFELLSNHYQKWLCVYQVDEAYRYQFALDWEGEEKLLADLAARGGSFLELSCFLSQPKSKHGRSWGANLLAYAQEEGWVVELVPPRVPLHVKCYITNQEELEDFLSNLKLYFRHFKET
ncbi:MAG: hypothetical protein EAZ57_07865 [Cytophagales bacterium]|nr:MAG: hypothetical protein EAZ67_08945 [Cytophagales bacterium]TAF60251.1 MAG: hypothetical protein EAZ57_07865 [Cytophagales bacterium]